MAEYKKKSKVAPTVVPMKADSEEDDEDEEDEEDE